ncbi:MAG: hypothetical protein M1830_005706, partial [Pleopsidium flavum]
ICAQQQRWAQWLDRDIGSESQHVEIRASIEIFDEASSFLGGVTRSLYISYLRAVPIGETIRINSHVIQHGRTMAMIRGEMVSRDGKTTYATCDHHKVNVATKEAHMASKVAAEAEQTFGAKAKL